MTRDEIIRMAREAGFVSADFWPDDFQGLFACVERFAALVAATERRKHQADIEKWKGAAVTAEKWRSMALSKDGDGRTVRAIQAEARDWEREACAKVCESEWIAIEEREFGQELAALIRARGNP